MSLLRTLLSCVLVLFTMTGLGCGRASGPPYSPQDALKTFQIEPGFRIEAFAAEPDVISPVAIEFDEDGRIFVVEDRGYPQDFEGKLGRIKMLLDTNGDGRPDQSTIFADHLEMPTGVMRWKKGILVTAAPDIWYFEDTNQDGRADIRKKILTGFAVSNPQHTVNGPVYGLDNWVYVAHKSMIAPQSYRDKYGGEETGGDIRFVDKAGIPPLTKQGRNLRIRPDAHRIEALAGYSQFGHAFDDWGRHFATDNAIHIRHEAIRAEYLDRNPDLPLETAMEDISDHGNSTDVFPITENPEIAHVTGFGKSTSTCGITLVLSDVFPPALWECIDRRTSP